MASPMQLVAAARRPAVGKDVRGILGFLSTELFMAPHSLWGNFSEMGVLFGDAAAGGGASTSGRMCQTSYLVFTLDVHARVWNVYMLEYLQNGQKVVLGRIIIIFFIVFVAVAIFVVVTNGVHSGS